MRSATPFLPLALLACSAEPTPPPEPTTDTGEPAGLRIGQTRAETITQVNARFDRLDANRDGVITLAEAPPNRPNFLRRLDPKGEGTVARARMVERATRRFDRVDADHDGTLSAIEIAAGGGPRAAGRRNPPGER